jgi:hypothetical protein
MLRHEIMWAIELSLNTINLETELHAGAGSA